MVLLRATLLQENFSKKFNNGPKQGLKYETNSLYLD